jgi:hypothetical protein
MSDLELLERFERGDLGELPHADHVRLAWMYVRREGPDGAREAMEAGLRRFAAANNVPEKYHHTITCAWIRLVAEAARRIPTSPTFVAFAAAHPQLFDRGALAAWYSPELLASERARREWVAPDRQPLP